MKKKILYIFLTIAFFVFLILPVTAAADDTSQLTQGQANQSGIKLGLRITGGGFPLMRNDFNDHLQSCNDYYEDLAIYTVNSEFEMIKMGMDFSGEMLVSFMPNFSIGIGAGYLLVEKETTAELSDTTWNEDEIYNIKFSVIPITLSFYYGIPLGSSMKIVMNAGLGYYLGTVDFDYSFEGDSGIYTYEATDAWSAQSNAFGFHGGIDLELGIARNLFLIVGAKGRYAKLTDLTGTEKYEYNRSDGFSFSFSDEGETLWYGDYESTATGKKSPWLELAINKPSTSYWSNVRKAEANLSGIVFQAGIKITF